MKVAIVAACVAVGLAGCATNVGTQTINDFGRYQQVQPGQTSKKQLHAIFGQPHVVKSIPETKESVWSYYQVASRMNPTTFIPFVGLATGGNDLDMTRADFYFDVNEVLLKSQREQRSKYVNQWIGLADAMTRSYQVDAVKAEMDRLGLPFDKKEAQIAAGWADLDQ